MPWSEVQAEAPKEEEEKVRWTLLLETSWISIGAICEYD